MKNRSGYESTMVSRDNHQYVREPLKLDEELPYLLYPLFQSQGSGSMLLSFVVHNIKPVVQNGPMCGLVALSMASQLLHCGCGQSCHPESVLQFAREERFSLQGEVFSVEYMMEIAKRQIGCEGKVVPTDSVDFGAVVSALTKGHSILVPYDADKDHTPCLARGHRAHWCILIGFTIILARNWKDHGILDCFEPNPSIARHYTLKDKAKDTFAGRFSDAPIGPDSVYVFTRHGKSRHIGLWSLESLLDSNRNLVEVGPQRNPEEFVIPEGGIVEGLCSKVLVLSKQ